LILSFFIKSYHFDKNSQLLFNEPSNSKALLKGGIL